MLRVLGSLGAFIAAHGRSWVLSVWFSTMISKRKCFQKLAFYNADPFCQKSSAALGRAWAFLDGRDYVIPEDVQAVLPTVVGHRLRERADATGHGGGALVQWLLREVPAL